MTSRYYEEVYVSFGIVSYLCLVAQFQHLPNILNLCWRSGIPLEIALQIIGLHIPEFIVTILPTFTLLGTFFLARRFVLGPHEKHAIDVACSQKRLIIGIGALATLVSFGINELVVPTANSIGRKKEFSYLYKYCGGSGWSNVTHIERGPNQDFGRVYYIGMLDGRKSDNVLLVDFKKDKFVNIIKADCGEFNQSDLHLKSARVITIGEAYCKSKLDSLTVGNTDNFQSSLHYARIPLREMSARDLVGYLKVLKEANSMDNDIFIRLCQKLTSPIDCLIVALLGAQLACVFSGRSCGLAYAIAILIFSNILRVASEVIGLSGRLDPFFAAALPTIFLALISLILFLKSLKHCVRSPQLSVFKADITFILSLFGMLP